MKKTTLNNCAYDFRGSIYKLARDRGAAGSSVSGVTALCPWARHVNPSLVLVQPKNTRPLLKDC